MLRFSCADRFISYDDDLVFFCAVAVFWLDMNNAIRELVKERVPIRCLERLRGVKLGSYLGAKIFWMISLCAIQTILFFTTMRICPVNIMSGKEFDSEVENVVGSLVLSQDQQLQRRAERIGRKKRKMDESR